MKQSLAVFNSDQVNRSPLWYPASELMKAEERHQMARLGSGLPRGLLVNIQHDMHRPVGWSQVLGHLLDGAMVRVIGLMQDDVVSGGGMSSYFPQTKANRQFKGSNFKVPTFPVSAYLDWIELADLQAGTVFRAIDR